MGRLFAYLVQMKSPDLDGVMASGAMNMENSYRKYERHKVPEAITKRLTEFELLVESI